MAKKPLEWNVFCRDFNGKEITTRNVFNKSITDELKKKKKKCASKEEFSEELRHIMMYYYWSKFEHEVVITSFPVRIDIKELDRVNSERGKCIKENGKEPCSLWIEPDMGSKIDIYKQLEINWDKFLDYVWDNV